MNRMPITATCFCAFLTTVELAQGDFIFDDFGSPSGLVLNGDAAPSSGILRLTPSAYATRGSAWFAAPQLVEYGFLTSFQFRISDLGGRFNDILGNPGADGFAFVIQNSGVTALGAPGGGMGYGGDAQIPGIANSLAVEFDTWFNPASETNDPNGNHLSVHTRGVLPNSAHHNFSIGVTTSVPDFSDGNVHNVIIRYVPGSLSVYVDDLMSPRLTVATDLTKTLALSDGTALVGFTSSTFNAWENHDIVSWRFTAAVPEPSSAVVVCVGGIVFFVRRRKNLTRVD